MREDGRSCGSGENRSIGWLAMRRGDWPGSACGWRRCCKPLLTHHRPLPGLLDAPLYYQPARALRRCLPQGRPARAVKGTFRPEDAHSVERGKLFGASLKVSNPRPAAAETAIAIGVRLRTIAICL